MTPIQTHAGIRTATAADAPFVHQRTAREFARARRHSRFVSFLKIGLPLVAVAIVAGGIAVTWLARSLPENVSVASTFVENGRMVMEDPNMSGYDKQGRPYSMVARRAFPSLNGAGVVDLEGIRANLTVADDTTADIEAAKGTYDQKAETLRLFGNISVKTSSGMTMKLSEADIDMKTGTMTGVGPVAIDTQTQTIRSGSMQVADSGKTISFGDRVKMTLMPNGADTVAQTLPKADDL
ncbi:LPS export ABC transporter periplasmic protein LptC [Mangrovicella endophytica]|uniref:LPS export ABC transporter periplasmic protein LptC n=1 Tax=Mangrovicella endophytica TaxID=2066697 RepID=UPI001FE0E65F|nr:LPS export ABC transporter periplasmic protein LptC [Mangrovicella endophytica]